MMNTEIKLELFIGMLYFFILYSIFNHFNNGILQISQIIFMTLSFGIIYFCMNYGSEFIMLINN